MGINPRGIKHDMGTNNNIILKLQHLKESVGWSQKAKAKADKKKNKIKIPTLDCTSHSGRRPCLQWGSCLGDFIAFGSHQSYSPVPDLWRNYKWSQLQYILMHGKV